MNRNDDVEATPWHVMGVTEVASRLSTDPRHGLTSREAAARHARYGSNELQAARHVSTWTLVARQFRNVLIVVLLIAVGLSVLLGHALEATAIAVILVFSVVLGFLQEFRAERALDALRGLAAPTATAIRDGVSVEIPARELVPRFLEFIEASREQ